MTIKGFLRLFVDDIDFGDHLHEVIKKSTEAFIVKFLGTFLKILFGIIVARLLGASGAGVYFLSIAVISVSSVVARLGVDGALLRFLSEYAEKNDWQRITSFFRKGVSVVLVTSFLVSLLLYVLAAPLSTYVFQDNTLLIPLKYISLSIIPFSIISLIVESLRALRKIKYSMILSELAIPAINIPLVVVLGYKYGVPGAAVAYTLSVFFVLLVGVYVWKKGRTPQVKQPDNSKTEINVSQIFSVSISMFWISFMTIIMAWTDTIVLAVWEDSSNVGIYNVAMRIAIMTSSVLVAVNSIMAPKFSALFVRDKLSELERLGRKVTLIMLIVVTPILVLFIWVPDFFLAIFGDEFKAGSVVLIILAIGQLVNVMTGSVGYLLIMSGYEKLLRNNALFTAFANIILNVVLIPSYGILGAAIATSISTAMMNLISTVIVYKKLSISIMPFVRLASTRN